MTHDDPTAKPHVNSAVPSTEQGHDVSLKASETNVNGSDDHFLSKSCFGDRE